MNADTLFDLIVTIDAQRRFLDAAALGSGDPARRARYRRQSRTQAMTISKVTRDLARHGKRHASLSGRELEAYVDSLIDAYTDDGPGPFSPSGTVLTAPGPRMPG